MEDFEYSEDSDLNVSGFQIDEEEQNEDSDELSLEVTNDVKVEENTDEDTSSSDENEEEHVQDDTDKEENREVKRGNPIKQRFRKVISEKNEALRYAEDVERRNSILEAQLMEYSKRVEAAEKAAITHFDFSLKNELEQAEKDNIQALAEGDYEKANEAQKRVAAATTKMEQSKYWEAQESWRQEQEAIRASQQRALLESQMAQEQQALAMENEYRLQNTDAWLKRNSWFDENSRNFNPSLSKKIDDFSEDLENYFHSRNQSHLIGSDVFFNAIDKKVSELSSNLSNRGQMMTRNSGRGQMSAPIRSGSVKAQNSLELSNAQKKFAKIFGVDEKSYAKNRLNDIKKGRAFSHGRLQGGIQMNSFKI